MEEYINHLKTKPEHHRRRIALGASTAITALVFVLWASVTVPQTTQVVAQASETKTTQKGESPIATLKTSAAQAYEGMRQVWNSNTSSVTQVNLEKEYSNIKSQVENGDIKITPDRR
jgi:predicted PurR-regulated permease PerM